MSLSVIGKMSDLEEYSTKTLIAFTNIIINVENFFNYMPIHDISIECKNTRKKRMKDLYHIDDKVEELCDGSLICMKWNNKSRGTVLKTASVVRNSNIKKKRDKFFLNSITTNIFFKQNSKDKLVNIKITKTGRFQITGCKNDELAIKSIQFLYNSMREAERWTGKKIFTLQNKLFNYNVGNNCGCFIKTVMKNRNVNIGFSINREKLDMLINNNYDKYISIFDGTTSGAGVNIKIQIDEDDEDDLLFFTFDGSNTTTKIITNKEFSEISKDKPLKKKTGYHTFLCFKSGSCIHSGKGKNMVSTFNNFLNILTTHRSEICE